MKLLTRKLEKRFAQVGRQDGDDKVDPIVVCKMFFPAGVATWYLCELHYCLTNGEMVVAGQIPGLKRGDPTVEDIHFWGWATLFPGEGEHGYVALSEMESFKGTFGLGIERDLYFDECPLSKCIALHERRV